MILLNSHLLFPHEADYAPSPEQLLSFFNYLRDMGMLSMQSAVRLRIPTDEDIYARNPSTGEKICIGNNITITVLGIHGNVLKLGIEAPRGVRVLRSELQPSNPALPDVA